MLLLVNRYGSGVRRHHPTWSQAAVCLRRGNSPKNHRHHQKGLWIKKLSSETIFSFLTQMLTNVAVFIPGLWRSLWCDELQTLKRRRELRLAHSWSGRHGGQGSFIFYLTNFFLSVFWNGSIKCLFLLFPRVLCRLSSEERTTRQKQRLNMWRSSPTPSQLQSEVTAPLTSSTRSLSHVAVY